MKLDTSRITDGVAIHCPKKEYVRKLFDALDLPESAIIKLEEYWEINEGNTHFLKDFDDIPPFYIAESKNWNFSHKDWCIKNGYTIIPFTDLIIEEGKKSRLAEILGVEEDAPFTWSWFSDVYRIHDGDREIKKGSEWLYQPDEELLTRMINHPEGIKPPPRWTPEEQEMAKKDSFRFKYVAMDDDTDSRLFLYEDKPSRQESEDIISCNYDCDSGFLEIDEAEYPSLQPGECVSLEEIAGGYDDD